MILRTCLLGRKRGMGQIFYTDGSRVAVTVIEAQPNVILRVKSEKGPDGYNAIQVGFDEKPSRLVNKPDRGQFSKLKITPKRVIREFRIPAADVERYEAGHELNVKLFAPGQRVDVIGTSKGHGYTGVMVRHNMRGNGTITHGSHEHFRHPGSIGCNTFPAHIWKGHPMAGHYGAEQVTVQNVLVADVVPHDNVILVRGAIPGPKNGLVLIRHAVKKPQPELSATGEAEGLEELIAEDQALADAEAAEAAHQS